MSDTANTAAPADNIESQVSEVEETIPETEEASAEDTTIDPVAPKVEEPTKAQVQEMKRRLKLKVDGREIEEEVDLNNEDYLREMLQKGKSADSKFQKASKIEKDMKDLIKLFQEDPYEALVKMGHDPDVLAEKRIEQKIKEMEKSPEQLQLEKLQKELEKKDKVLKQIEQEKLEAEKAKVYEEFSRQLDTEITDALSSSTLPKSPYVVSRLAQTMMDAIGMGYADVRPQDILPVVEKQIRSEIQQMFGVMPEDVIEEMLGKDVSEKLRKSRLKKMKSAPETANAIKATGKAEEKVKSSEKTKVNAIDFWKKFGDY